MWKEDKGKWWEWAGGGQWASAQLDKRRGSARRGLPSCQGHPGNADQLQFTEDLLCARWAPGTAHGLALKHRPLHSLGFWKKLFRDRQRSDRQGQ